MLTQLFKDLGSQGYVGQKGVSPNRLERGQLSQFVTGNSLEHFLALLKRQ